MKPSHIRVPCNAFIHDQNMMKKLIGVIGAGQCSQDIADLAYDVGKHIAENGYSLICGGLGGVMEAASRGCNDHGGLTIGIIPQEESDQANPYVDIVIPTGMGIMRNLLIVRSAEVLIAVNGKFGTLSEIAFALQLNKPIIGLNTWDVSDNIIKADDAADAVQKAMECIVQ